MKRHKNLPCAAKRLLWMGRTDPGLFHTRDSRGPQLGSCSWDTQIGRRSRQMQKFDCTYPGSAKVLYLYSTVPGTVYLYLV